MPYQGWMKRRILLSFNNEIMVRIFPNGVLEGLNMIILYKFLEAYIILNSFIDIL